MSATSVSNAPTWYDQLSKNFGDVVAGGVENYSNLSNNWYSDPLVQGLNPLQTGALSAATSAPGAWQPQFNNAGGTLGTATGQAAMASNFDPNQNQQFMNPYLQGAQQATTNLSNQNLFETVMPRVNSTFTGAGQFGSTRNADFMNRAIRDQQLNLTNSLGALNYGAQTEANKNQLGWGQLGTQGAQVMGGLGQLQQGLGTATTNNTWQDILNQLQAGGVQQGQGQRELDASYTDWQNQLKLPNELMGTLSKMLPQFTDLYKTNNSTITMPDTAQQSTGGTLDYLLAAMLGGLGAQR